MICKYLQFCEGYSSQLMKGSFFLTILEEFGKLSLKTVALINRKLEVCVQRDYTEAMHTVIG